MSLVQEAPRRPDLIPKFYRLRLADLESRRQIDEYYNGLSDQSLKVGEPMSVGSQVLFTSPGITEQPSAFPIPVFTGVRLADRRAVVINTLLASPDQPATQSWVDLMNRQFSRIIRFARTAVNKGRPVDPAFR